MKELAAGRIRGGAWRQGRVVEHDFRRETGKSDRWWYWMAGIDSKWRSDERESGVRVV